jgi:pyridoxine kinase
MKGKLDGIALRMPTPTVLVISSQVAAGPVGASAVAPALLSLGVVPIVVPTIMLSNHPGHGRPEGLAIPAATIKAMLERLLELGLLADCTCVLTGYFARAEQVAVAADFIATLGTRIPELYLLCDPVIGDNGEPYVKEEIAAAIRDRLVPPAQGLTPNAFEAGWLSGIDIRNLADAQRAARHWPGKDVVVTSIPEGPERLATALFSRGKSVVVSRTRLANVPHGTGDLLSGLLAGHIARGDALDTSLAEAMRALDTAIAASRDSACLDLAKGLAS